MAYGKPMRKVSSGMVPDFAAASPEPVDAAAPNAMRRSGGSLLSALIRSARSPQPSGPVLVLPPRSFMPSAPSVSGPSPSGVAPSAPRAATPQPTPAPQGGCGPRG